MGVAGCSSLGLRSVFVVCGLVVIAYANIKNDDDEWIDPYDMINYDPTTKRMRKPTESASYNNVPTKRREFTPDSCDLPQCPDVSDCTNKLQLLQKEINEHTKKGGTTAQKPICLPVFKRFLSKLLKETGKLGLPNDAKTIMHYDTEVKLSKQTVAEFKKLLKEDNDWTTGAMDDALGEILVNFKYHDPEAWKWRFEDTFYVEVDTVVKVLLCVLMVTAVICTEMWSAVSWFIQFKRMFAVCFFISLIWNWFHLYMLAFADHQKNAVQLERSNAKCTGMKQMDWKDSLSEWYRRTWTLQDDPCKKYYEVLLVNPILLVPPTKAITVTITNFITDPLKHIGQGISEFLRALLMDLPVTLQIPVLFMIMGAIFVFIYGGAQAAVQHALPWPRFGRRRDPPPPAVGQRQDLQLREHDNWAGGDAPQPLQVRQEGNRPNHVRNGVNQGLRATDANANAPQARRQEIRTPQPEDNHSMGIGSDFVGRLGVAQRVQVENLHATANISGEDDLDSQQRRREQDPGVEGGEEPKVDEVSKEEKEKNLSTKEKKDTQGVEKPKVDEVPKVEKEKNPSTKEKKEQKDTQHKSVSQDRSDNEPTSNAPSKPINVKTIGANEGNDVQGASADVATVLEQEKSFRTPVQETGS